MYVYGLLEQALATTVSAQKDYLWSVPDSWSLEQAATVPVVYSTAYYALVVRGRLQAGNKVLIHSGSGGVGQAAIAVALHCGCDVYTTVSSQEVSIALSRNCTSKLDLKNILESSAGCLIHHKWTFFTN